MAPVRGLLEVGLRVLRRDGDVQPLAVRVLLALLVPGLAPTGALAQPGRLVAELARNGTCWSAMISFSTSHRSASGPSSSRATETTSASARSRSASRLTVIGLGCSAPLIGREPQRPVLAPVQQPGRERRPLLHLPRLGLPPPLALGPLDQRRYSGRFSMSLDPLGDDRLVLLGPVRGISVIGVERCRANHCVSISPAVHPAAPARSQTPAPPA